MLWFPVGYTVGYVVLLVLVAAPLRRSGAYTLPDFAEARLESRQVRALASLLVIGIGWLYLLPQFQGAGIALSTVTGAPPASRQSHRRRGRAGQRDGRRDAVDHPRAGHAVLAQAHRDLGPGLRPARAVVAERRAGPERHVVRRRRLGAGAQRLRRARTPRLRDVLDDPRALLRHDGTAARAGPLLHQPRRPRGPSHDARRGRAARALLPVHAGLRRARPRLPPDPAGRRPGRLGDAAAALRHRSGPARHGPLRRPRGRRVRRVPLHRLRPDHLGRRRHRPGLPRPHHRPPRGRRRPADPDLPARGRRRRRRPVRRELAGGQHQPCRHRRARLRGGGVDVLPAAGPRRLVAAALGGRGHGGTGDRRRARPHGDDDHRPRRAGSVGGGWLGALLAQPAAWTVPTAFLVAVLVSYATPGSVPVGTSRTMVRLHAPEDLRAADPPTRSD